MSGKRVGLAAVNEQQRSPMNGVAGAADGLHGRALRDINNLNKIMGMNFRIGILRKLDKK